MLIKKHLSIAKQIDLLKSRKLKIDDFNFAKKYLTSFNYQKIINGYNDPFMKNFDRNTNIYDFNSSFNSIVTLKDFDKKMAVTIFEYLESIESSFSNKLSYFISEKLNKLGKTDGKILNSDKNLFNYIFSIEISDDKMFTTFTKYIDEKEKLYDKYRINNVVSYSEIPIWVLSLSWTFGDLIKIFKWLNKDIQYKIINSYSNMKWSIDEFINIMESLNKIRNKIAHNRVIYNLDINNIRIYEWIKIIDKIINNLSLVDEFLLDKINKLIFDKIIYSEFIPEQSKYFILEIMGFEKNSFF